MHKYEEKNVLNILYQKDLNNIYLICQSFCYKIYFLNDSRSMSMLHIVQNVSIKSTKNNIL